MKPADNDRLDRIIAGRRMSFEFDGAEYLRKLKQSDVGQSTPAVPPAHELTLPISVAQPPSGPERRKSPRYACHGSAKFSQKGSEVHSWGSFTDISLHGCYIEVTATFPLGSRLWISLELGGLRAEMEGEVRVSYPFLGMGIAFREISEENRRRLGEMVRSLAYGIPPRPASSEKEQPDVRPKAQKTPSDARRALEALVDFFETRQLLTREEFYRVLRDNQTGH
jgi:PilZ domain